MKRCLVPIGTSAGSEAPPDTRAEVAAEPVLPWPPTHGPKQSGRPSLDEQWTRLAQRALQENGELPAAATNSRPSWWSPGQGLTKPEVIEGDIEEALPQQAEGTVLDVHDAALVRPSKRHKEHVSPELRDWSLGYHADNAKRRKWTMTRSVREASRLCPEFERVRIDTPRKWKAS
eukprot:3740527-Amphidinium_carterae.1